jgi:hypothetical protein
LKNDCPKYVEIIVNQITGKMFKKINRMKRILMLLIFSLIALNCMPQEKGRTRFGLETGILIPNEGGIGLNGAIESKYNIQNNTNVGLRLGKAVYIKHKSYSAILTSLNLTFDYYIHPNDKFIAPFIGIGIGYFFSEATDFVGNNGEGEYSKYNNPNCFLRIGTEIKKIRLAITYNVNRKPGEPNIYNKNNDYVSLLLGFYIGGGKWEK